MISLTPRYHFLINLKKLWFALLGSRRRMALKLGCAPAVEHRRVIGSLPGDMTTVMDVGANVGQFAQMARATWPTASLHCFEPIKSAYNILQSVFEGDAKTSVYICGLGSEKSQLTINLSGSLGSCSILPSNLQKIVVPWTVGGEEIEINRLDEACTMSHCDHRLS